MNKEEIIIKILENRRVNCADPYCNTFSSLWLVKELNVSKYIILKHLRVLKEKGFVDYGYFDAGCGLPFWAWEFKGNLKNTYFL
jgi:predicted ArsR family transcriptional regulator